MWLVGWLVDVYSVGQARVCCKTLATALFSSGNNSLSDEQLVCRRYLNADHVATAILWGLLHLDGGTTASGQTSSSVVLGESLDGNRKQLSSILPTQATISLVFIRSSTAAVSPDPGSWGVIGSGKVDLAIAFLFNE